jgi:nitrosocyanin
MKKTLLALAIAAFIPTMALAETAKVESEEAHAEMAKTEIKSEAGVRVINVVNEKINDKTRYSPSVFIVKKGEKVRFKIFNATTGPHGFSIDAFNIKATLVPNENTVEFTPNKEGLFEVYCQFHPAHLTGQLLVVK